MSGFALGVYRWTYKNGAFNVCFRPQGVFFCSKYPSNASWTVNADALVVDWKNYGTYEFPLKDDLTSLDGHATGKPENWRKLEFVREFSAGERLLLGDGFGSAWDFQYEKGHFEVRFQCDGFNHFVCPQYPAHSHWSMDEETGDILVNWGSYGTSSHCRMRASPNRSLNECFPLMYHR